MGFRNPVLTAVDTVAREAAADAQATADAAAGAASAAADAAADAATAASSAQTAADNAATAAADAYTEASSGIVAGSRIAAETVAGDRLIAGTITANEIAAGAVTTAQLAAGAVTAGKLAAGAITAEKIAAGAIDGVTITGATVRTSATGKRTTMDGPNGLRFFAGLLGETPGKLGAVPYGADPEIMQGHELVVDAGASNIDGPKLALLVESAPAGGYQTVAELRGASLLRLGAAQLRPAVGVTKWTAANFASTSFQNYPGGALGDVELYRDADGIWHLDGTVSPTVSVTPGASAVVFRMTTDQAPRKTQIRGVIVSTNVLGRIEIGTDGRILYTAGPTLPAGGFIDLSGLRWLGKTM